MATRLRAASQLEVHSFDSWPETFLCGVCGVESSVFLVTVLVIWQCIAVTFISYLFIIYIFVQIGCSLYYFHNNFITFCRLQTLNL